VFISKYRESEELKKFLTVLLNRQELYGLFKLLQFKNFLVCNIAEYAQNTAKDVFFFVVTSLVEFKA